MDPEEAARVVAPYVVREITDPAEWRAQTWPVYRRIVGEAIKRAIYGGDDLRFVKTEQVVSRGYSQKWINSSVADRDPIGVATAVTWGRRRLVVDSRGLRRLYISRLMRLIEQLRPTSVLDLGCGNGEKLLVLACRFPEVQFHGLELTPGGVSAAIDVQQHAELPRGLVDLSPQPLRDLGAHRSVNFRQGSAREMPFATGSIDLVYTSLAIEQMQTIKDAVLTEVGRVASKHASFFEAFRDFNRGPVQRLYNYAETYFRGELVELRRVGFQDVRVFTDLPQKIWMNNVHVLASKDPRIPS